MNKLLGSRIKALRSANNLTQEEVADQIGISRQKYARIESGVNSITLDILSKVAKILGVTVGDITKVLDETPVVQYRAGEENESSKKIFDMLDLFYANKHMCENGVALLVEFLVCGLQGAYPTWLISGMGITLMTLFFYLTLENPDILRAELTEQKMSMLYLKSQVNPHFLYNTLDTIRIQAQLNGDKKVADLLMRLVDFFRISVKVDRQMVALDDELELLEAYMDLMCYRYPNLHCEYDIDPDLGGSLVPNFILQSLVENSLLHGLKNKGYRGEIVITAKKEGNAIEILIRDSGSGFTDGRKDIIDEMLLHYDKKQAKLEGNSIGILNVQKRIKLLCGPKYGLSYMENETGGVTARLLLPHEEDAK